MADSILRLKVESQEYNAKLKRAADGLNRYVENCRKVGGTLEHVEQETLDFVKAIGRMETVSKTASGKLSEMKKAFTEFSMQYKEMSAAEKNSPVGRALSQSLDQLRTRIRDTQRDLQSINQELNGGKFGQFGSILDGIGQKMGINSNVTELLTSRTALLAGAVGAGTTAVVAATKAWADYNAEIAKQQQITTVTTGLKGDEADRMTAAARALSKTYNTDFRESINAANTLMSQFGETGDNAIKLLRDGMRGMIMGDGGKLLSMIQQYAPAFRDAGVSASQLVAVIQNSEGGIFTDQNMNAIVMGIKNIRLMTKATSDALGRMGIDGQKMSEQLSNGTLTIFDALKQVARQLQTVDSNSQTAGEVMQQVFGRQGAMAGTNLGKAIEGLNTNLEETKRQTGEVGQTYDDLYQANVRLEKALQQTFGYKGWEEMATGIKTELVTAMANVLELTNKIKESWVGDIGKTIFDSLKDAALNATGPLRVVLAILNQINKEREKGGESNPNNKNYEYIKGGGTKSEREDRYNKVLAGINAKLANIGQEKTRVNKDGSTSFYVDSIEEQQRQRQQLLDKRTQLILNRDTLLAGNPAKPTTPTHPSYNSPTTNTTGGSTTDKEQSIRDHVLTQWLNAEAKAANAVEVYNGVVMTSAEAEKQREKAARELEASQKKLADTQKKRAELEESWKTPSLNAMSTLEQDLKKRQSTQAVGSADFNGLQTNIVDIKTLQNLINTQLKNGLTIDPEVSKKLMAQIVGGADIPDETWQKLQEEINTKLKEMNLPPIKINFETGGLENVNKDVDALKKTISTTARVVGTIGMAFNAIQDPAAKVAATVAQAIANVALAYSDAMAKDTVSKFNLWAFIPAAAAATIQMASTIASIHSATGYAEGGMIKGNSYSGDKIGGLVDGSQFVGLNAGELVLNASQQSMLAGNLQNSGISGMNLRAVLRGEDVILMLDRTGQRKGYGELAFFK